MNSMRVVRTQILRMGAELQAKPLIPVQFTAQVQSTLYGELEDADVIPADPIQNADGTFADLDNYDDIVS